MPGENPTTPPIVDNIISANYRLAGILYLHAFSLGEAHVREDVKHSLEKAKVYINKALKELDED